MKSARYLYSEIASALGAIKHLNANNNEGWKMWGTRLVMLEGHLPSGSGFDNRTILDLENSHEDKLVMHTSFHHMNDGGYYDGWTDHTVTVVPSLTCDFHIRVSGRNRNDIKDYIAETFDAALRQDMTYWLLLDIFPQYKIRSEWKDQCTQVHFVDGFAGLHEFARLDQAIEYAAALMQNAFLNQVAGKETE